MDSKKMTAITSKIALRTVLMIVLALGLCWSLHPRGLIFQVFNNDLSFILSPTLVASAVFYFSSLIAIIFVGDVINMISNSLNRLGAALWVFLLISNPPAPEAFRPLGFWVLICLLVLISHQVASHVADLYNHSLVKVLATSLSLLAAGFVSSKVAPVIATFLPWNIGSSLSTILFLSFTLVSMISVARIFDVSSSPYLNYVGKKLGSSSVLFYILFLSTLVFLYFFNIRSYFIEEHPVYVPLMEWIVVCLVSFTVYRKLHSQTKASLSEPLKLGHWTRLQHEVDHNLDLELIDVSRLIADFTEDGAKEGILVYIISALTMNNVGLEATRELVSKLVEYQDIPPPRLTPAWRVKGVEDENRRRRRELLQAVLDEVQSEILAPKVDIHRARQDREKAGFSPGSQGKYEVQAGADK